MRNKPIGANEAVDIREQVDKILRGLGSPEPPLDLDAVRELLELDRQYYSATDTGFLREFVSRVKVGTKLVAKDPLRLLEVVKHWKLRALWLPETSRILIDLETPEIKQRWAETHEIIHGITPWHKRYLLGDDRETLRQSCHVELEAEANFGAGQLLFLQGRFVEEATSSPASMDLVFSLSKSFGNTLTSTLWRLVEEAHQGLPLLGVVSVHPKREPSADAPCRYVIESPAFRERFSAVSDHDIFSILKSYCSRARGGPLGETEATLTDANGDRHVFHLKSFSNSHEVLTLAVYKHPVRGVIAVP